MNKMRFIRHTDKNGDSFYEIRAIRCYSPDTVNYNERIKPTLPM